MCRTPYNTVYNTDKEHLKNFDIGQAQYTCNNCETKMH